MSDLESIRLRGFVVSGPHRFQSRHRSGDIAEGGIHRGCEDVNRYGKGQMTGRIMRQIGTTTTTRTVRMARGPAGALEPRGRWTRSQGCENRSGNLLHGLPEKISGVTIEEQRLVIGGQRLRCGVGERAHHMGTGIGDGITRADIADRRRVSCELVYFPDGREAVGVNRRENRRYWSRGYDDSE